MSTRLVNKITGADREFPDRLAAMLIADKSSGWAKPSKRQSNKTAATDGDTEPGE